MVGSRPKQVETCWFYICPRVYFVVGEEGLRNLEPFSVAGSPWWWWERTNCPQFPWEWIVPRLHQVGISLLAKGPLSQDSGSERKEQARKMKARTISCECGEGQKKEQNPLDMNYNAPKWKPTAAPGVQKSSRDKTQWSDSWTSLQLVISKECSRES